MSGTRKRDVSIRIAVEQIDQARQKLEALGADGQKALERIGIASTSAQPGMQKLAAASDAAVNSIGGFARAVPGAEGAVDALGRGLTSAAAGYAAIGLAAGAAAVAVARAGDQMTASLAKLGVATGGPDGAVRAYEKLFQLSQQTGVAVAESADSFVRFAVAARQVGATNDQVLALVKTIQQAGIVSGASTEELKATTLQLGQALASGVLQGDELRSLLENMPTLAEKLAGQLGVSVGELRKMGAAGELTASRVLPALLRAGEQINEEFAKMPVTMSRGFDILGAAMTNFAANLDKALGLSQAIARAAVSAAGAVNVVTERFLPNERQAADQAVEAARARIAQLETQTASGRGADPLPQFGQRRGADAVQDVRGAMERAQRELQAALQARGELLARYNRDDREEELAAQRRAAATLAEKNREEAKKIEESLDPIAKARAEYADTIEKINQKELAGAFSITRATELRALAQEKLNEVLSKAAEAELRYAGSINFDSGLLTVTESDDKAIKAAQKTLEQGEKNRKAVADIYEKEEKKKQDLAEKTTDSIVQYAGDKFADLFSATGGGWAKLMENLKTTAVATFARIAAEALIRPIVMPIVTSLVGGVQGGASGLLGNVSSLFQLGQSSGIGGALGLGNPGSVLSGLGDVGGLFSGVSSFLNTPLLGSAQSLAATNAALGSLGGQFGPATASQFAAAGGSSLSIGGLLGGTGTGFAAGSFLNGLVRGNQTGGQIGSGIGAIAGTIIGGPIGGLIGGSAGGLLGGLFGPGKKSGGYGWQIQGNGTDGFGLGSRVFVDPGATQLFEADRQAMERANAVLRQYGIGVSGLIEVAGNKSGPSRRAEQRASFDAGFKDFRFSAESDTQLNQVLDGRAFGSLQDLGKAIGFVKETLPSLLTPLSAFDQQMKQLTTTFDAAIGQARDYGVAEAELTKKKAERVADLTAARDASAASLTAGLALRYARATGGDVTAATLAQFDAQAIQEKLDLKAKLQDLGLADTKYAADRILDIEKTLAAERLRITQSYADQSRSLLADLTIGSGSALAPEQKYFAGLTLLNQAQRTLEAGGAVSDYISVAQQVLPVARDFLGTSERYAALTSQVASAVTSRTGDTTGLAALLEAQVGGQDQLTATVAKFGQAQLDVGNATVRELQRLISTMQAIIARQAA